MAVRDIWTSTDCLSGSAWAGRVNYVQILPTFSAVQSGKCVFLTLWPTEASTSSGTSGGAGTTVVVSGNYPWIG